MYGLIKGNQIFCGNKRYIENLESTVNFSDEKS